MKAKKRASLFLAAVMALGLTACSKNGTDKGMTRIMERYET